MIFSYTVILRLNARAFIKFLDLGGAFIGRGGLKEGALLFLDF